MGATKLQLAGRIQEIDELLRRTSGVWAETVAGDRLTYAPNLAEVNNALIRLNQLFAAIP